MHHRLTHSDHILNNFLLIINEIKQILWEFFPKERW